MFTSRSFLCIQSVLCFVPLLLTVGVFCRLSFLLNINNNMFCLGSLISVHVCVCVCIFLVGSETRFHYVDLGNLQFSR